ncbi:hypothetical protein [Nannocystis radixulma]|uniref:DUF2325 domain-containing protein n=1 Tax=Nannocystis radixulma TaxID=2995305 RepID=A0ABT5AXZ5_9BACT|nr:hypothetical protein [Nannocystis radixulma]MDC0666703.1 hypothetical protein [Nannocystis radixulma]
MSGDLDIDALLAELGLRAGEARDLGRAALEAAGLTRPGKRNLAAGKRPRVEEVIAEEFVRTCSRPHCRAAAANDGRIVVDLDGSAARLCEYCGGSTNRSAWERALVAMARRDWHRLVVVGGSPPLHHELRALVGGRIDLRLVDGTARRTAHDAAHDLAWADRIVVWGATLLDHKVSQLYTDRRSPKVVTVARRGLTALAETIIKTAQ